MPDPPSVGLLHRWVLENPWPLGAALLLAGAAMAWRSRGAGSTREARLGALAVAAAGAGVLLVGMLAVTAGERARQVTRALIRAAEAGDVAAASACFAEDATIAFGSTANPGRSRGAIDQRLAQLGGRVRVESNRIVMLRAYTESSEQATVHLACATTVQAGGFGIGPIPTEWVLVVRRDPGGAWTVSRITWISVNRQGVTESTGM